MQQLKCFREVKNSSIIKRILADVIINPLFEYLRHCYVKKKN